MYVLCAGEEVSSATGYQEEPRQVLEARGEGRSVEMLYMFTPVVFIT